ncbi:MAG: LysR family transcriptional regulator [Fibrobacter sp.]|uniref:LysR family transcriptional regulator n=1 Tax=Fibrobacter sp. TaxID=35828 RepID=UPI001B26ADC5|nr:LysR family transcriptional regulator [Fibrobacter sp.]MBO7061072.1 LysR family transcriptional regulator [Fibrobacter sp.]MBO7104347.1 LysR family transcriptional regulator [Fibrobacter sp.]MBR3670920.1 LysR family transcriptional regulator [Fibrobacter sp.]
MELTHLKYFLEVAKTEHVTKSARKLCIVQPALTQAIHKLEAELGVALFKMQGRNIKLTECGQFFYKRLQPLYDDIEALPDRLRAMANEMNQTVNLNVLAASSLVTNAVIKYKQTDPGLRINLIQNESTTLYDVCVNTFEKYEPEQNSDGETFVCSEKIFLAVPNTPQYKRRKSISLQDLKDENFIGLYGSKHLSTICDEFCSRVGFKTNVSFVSDNTTAVKDAIAGGVGVGFWPEFSWGRMDHRKVRLLEITDGVLKRDIVVRLLKNKQDNARVEQFFAFLCGYIKKESQKHRQSMK